MTSKKYTILSPPADELPRELMRHIFNKDPEPLQVTAAETSGNHEATDEITTFALHSLLLHRHPEAVKPYADVYIDGVGFGVLSFEPATLSFQAVDNESGQTRIGDFSDIPELNLSKIIKDKE